MPTDVENDLDTIEHLDFEACCEGHRWVVPRVSTVKCSTAAVCVAKTKCDRCQRENEKFYCEWHLGKLITVGFYCSGNSCGGNRYYITHRTIK